MKLQKAFYLEKDVTKVARDLLGKTLFVRHDQILCSGRIVETEAYSFREKACHAFLNRRTSRTVTLFAEGGTAYVYLCYGIHHLFNVVTNAADVAEAVLIRALEPLQGVETMAMRRNLDDLRQLTSGPGKLSQAMEINLSHDQQSLLGDELWIEDAGYTPDSGGIETGPRIGVDYAGEDALLPWRFGLRESPFLSRPF